MRKFLCHILYLFMIILFFKPYYFSYFNMGLINSIYLNGLRLAVILILIVYLIHSKISKFILTLLFFYFVKAISTFINNGSISSLITEIYPAVGICLLIEIGLSKRPKQLMRAFSTVLSFLIYINFALIILNPYGYGPFKKQIFFLKHANQLAPLYIIAVVVTLLRNNYYTSYFRKLHLFSIIIICTFMIFHVGSGSNVIAWLSIVMYFILPYIMKNHKLFNIKSYLTIYMGLFLGVIIYNIQNHFAGFLYKYLGKSETFSGRVPLWNRSLEMIKNKPLIGYGMTDTSNIILSSSGRYLSTHNQFIQLMVEGGVLSIFVFITVAYNVFKKLYQYKHSESAKILSVGIFAIMLVLFSEAMGFFELLILFVFSYNIDKINIKTALKQEVSCADTKKNSLLLVW